MRIKVCGNLPNNKILEKLEELSSKDLNKLRKLEAKKKTKKAHQILKRSKNLQEKKKVMNMSSNFTMR